jgi:hypothetical protein
MPTLNLAGYPHYAQGLVRNALGRAFPAALAAASGGGLDRSVVRAALGFWRAPIPVFTELTSSQLP